MGSLMCFDVVNKNVYIYNAASSIKRSLYIIEMRFILYYFMFRTFMYLIVL